MVTFKKALIYNDAGVSKTGINKLLTTIPKYLKIETELISAKQLIKRGISTDLFIIGGGADLPYGQLLNGKGNELIKNYVGNGGFYLGICAGAYYASNYVDFIGDGYKVNGERELAFFNGSAVGCLPELTNGNLYNEHNKNSHAFVELDNFQSELFYYHGGCAFISENPNVEIISRYKLNNKPAIIFGNYFAGKFLLSGVHFEYGNHIGIWNFIQDQFF